MDYSSKKWGSVPNLWGPPLKIRTKEYKMETQLIFKNVARLVMAALMMIVITACNNTDNV